MANVGEIITASVYNTIRARVISVLGSGVGDRGYGYNVAPWQPATASTVVTALKWNELRNYIQVARAHQIGNPAGYDASVLPVPVIGTPMTAALVNRFVACSDQLYNESLLYGVSSVALATNVFTTTRAAPWNGAIVSQVSVTWPSEDAARYFFNSGGDLRIALSHPNGNAGDNAWANVMAHVGVVAFSAHRTIRTGDWGAPAGNIGYYEIGPAGYSRILDGTDIDPTYAYRPAYQFRDDLYIYAMKITNGVRFYIEVNERNDGINSAGTAARFSVLRATQYLTNPAIIAPTFTLTQAF